MTNPATIDLNFERALYWMNVGAQPTDTVRSILSYEGVLLKKHLLEGVKKGAFDEAAAEAKFEAWKKEKVAKIQSKINRLADESESAYKARVEAEAKVKEARAELIAKKQAEIAAAKAEAEAAARAEVETAATEAAEAAETQAETETPRCRIRFAMIKKEDCIKIGEVGKTHSLQGAVVVYSDNDLLEQYKEEPVFILLEGAPVPFFIAKDGLMKRNHSSYIIKFDYVDSMAQADRLIGKELLMDKDLVGEKEEEDLPFELSEL